MGNKTFDGCDKDGSPNEPLGNFRIARIEGVQIGLGLPLFEKQLHLPSQMVCKAYILDAEFPAVQVRDQILVFLLFGIPGDDHPEDHRFTIDHPCHLKIRSLFLGQALTDLIEESIAKTARAGPIIKPGIDHPGVQTLFPPDYCKKLSLGRTAALNKVDERSGVSGYIPPADRMGVPGAYV